MGFKMRCLAPLLMAAALAAHDENNDCLLPRIAADRADGPREFNCAEFVVKSTDEIWNNPDRSGVNASIDKYFVENFLSFENGRVASTNLQQLKDAVQARFNAFPDCRIKITDCFCEGNDIDGYKTTMPDMVMGTNLGPTKFGPATGKKVLYTGLANTIVKKVDGQWKYVAEWVMHDDTAVMAQLGYTTLPPSLMQTVTDVPDLCDVWATWDPAGKGENVQLASLAAVAPTATHSGSGHSAMTVMVAMLCSGMFATAVTSMLLLRLRPAIGQQQAAQPAARSGLEQELLQSPESDA